jgi:hypothetical protein
VEKSTPIQFLRSFFVYHDFDSDWKGKIAMANENPNPLFAYAEARIAAWQAVLASLKAALSLDPSSQTGEGMDLSSIAGSQNGEGGRPIDLPDGAFFGKSVPACVKLYLSAARKKKTTKEIATALREGGVETTAGNFEGIVTTALIRLRVAGEVLKFKDGWGLSEWYPANMRVSGSVGKPAAKSKKKGKKTRLKGTSVSTSSAKGNAKKVTEITKPEDKPEPRILAFLKSNRREVAASEVATGLGLKIQTAHLVLAKLAHQKKIEKLASGHFKALGAVAS